MARKLNRTPLPPHRPSKYDPSMDQKVMDAMRQGMTKQEVASLLEINQDTLFDWINPESPRFIPSFSESIQQGMAHAEAYMLRLGRNHLVYEPNGPRMDSRVYNILMQNCFGYNSKQQVELDAKATVIFNHNFTGESNDED